MLAVVYNDYMAALGGGERSALAYACALQMLGYTVELRSRNPIPSTDVLVERFGGVARHVLTRQIHGFDPYESIDIFVNHSFMSLCPNVGKIGLYSQMFPMFAVDSLHYPEAIPNLRSYDRILCNSTFTLQHTRALWDVDPATLRVLNPPLGAEFTSQSKLVSPSRRRRVFVTVGRFDPRLHDKRQQEVIRLFLNAATQHSELSGWKLIVAGSTSQIPECRSYYDRCHELALSSGGIVQLLPNLGNVKLRNLLRGAFAYIQATGAFEKGSIKPYRCEHFGLALAEAVVSGCVPIAYNKAGTFDLLPRSTTVLFEDENSFIQALLRAVSMFGSSEADDWQCANSVAFKSLTLQGFAETLNGVIRECKGHTPSMYMELQ